MAYHRWMGATLTVGALACCSMLTAVTAHAAAATSWVSVTDTDAEGHSYYNTSSIFSPPDATRLYANTKQWTAQPPGNVPAGRLGVMATLWKYGSDGISYICDQAGYIYNGDAASSLTVVTHDDCGSGTYYSRGVVQTWQGSYYRSWYTFPTVNITYP